MSRSAERLEGMRLDLRVPSIIGPSNHRRRCRLTAIGSYASTRPWRLLKMLVVSACAQLECRFPECPLTRLAWRGGPPRPADSRRLKMEAPNWGIPRGPQEVSSGDPWLHEAERGYLTGRGSLNCRNRS